jgi:hypothetical protein
VVWVIDELSELKEKRCEENSSFNRLMKLWTLPWKCYWESTKFTELYKNGEWVAIALDLKFEVNFVTPVFSVPQLFK